jgi:hypothetical protein
VTLLRCEWCGRKFGATTGARGRPRLYCQRSCRQRSYEERRRVTELDEEAAAVRTAREERDALKDRLFLLGCALEDLDQTDTSDYDDALAAILDAARELCRYAATP